MCTICYNAARRLSANLEKLGLGPSALSQSGTASLRTLTSIGLLLDVRDAAMNRYTESNTIILNEAIENNVHLQSSYYAPV